MISDINNLVRLEKSQVKAASEVLSRAFYDDPLLSSFIPDPLQRKKKLHYLLETLVQYSVTHGEVYATSPNFEGVAVWLPSDRVDMTLWRGLRSGGLSIITHLGVQSTFRQLSDSDFICSVHKHHIKAPHWYLYLLGVDPVLRGQGYASKLVKPVLTRTEHEGMACWLDNTNENNLQMYQHYGFRVIEEYKIPRTGVRIWGMLKEA
jgi:ribosomal protein S18 acetylase RimI-like enzyme